MPPQFHYDSDEHHLTLTGDWTLHHYPQLNQHVAEFHRDWLVDRLSCDTLTELDTVGSQMLVTMLGSERLMALLNQGEHGLSAAREQLVVTVVHALAQQTETPLSEPSSPITQLNDIMVNIGRFMQQLGQQLLALIAFMGITLSVLIPILLQPKRWRVTSFMAHLQQTGFNALPIVILLTFLIGAVVAFLGATLLTKFGANIYTVHLVAFSFLREFGPLLAAIIIAGRTASAFTAQIGSMRAHEEIDAIRVLGLNAIELLVVPRLLALMVALPILTFVAMMSGILGGMLVAQLTLDISNTMFLSVMQQNVGLHHFWVGISKAPFFAFVIVMISCLEGFKVSGSAQSVGEHTTASVVQSIFMVIVIDAIFAIVCMEMGW
jgi:phospholipid/cholesterol/gamma-HCH transport system permease protein